MKKLYWLTTIMVCAMLLICGGILFFEQAKNASLPPAAITTLNLCFVLLLMNIVGNIAVSLPKDDHRNVLIIRGVLIAIASCMLLNAIPFTGTHAAFPRLLVMWGVLLTGDWLYRRAKRTPATSRRRVVSAD